MELFVDPSDCHGSGPASYRMSREGEQVWARTIPFTLRDVVVLDDGVAAGYAYPNGGYPPNGELVVAVLGPDGEVRGMERIERLWTVPHGASDPTAIAIRPCGGFFALQVCGPQRGSRRWWLYDWSTCRRLGEQRDEPMEAQGLAPAPNDPPLASLDAPDLELPLLGRLAFPWPVPPPEAGSFDERRYRQAHKVFVDGQGRVWISELSSRVVHSFDPSGRRLLDLTPEPWTFRPYYPVEWIAVRGDGHPFVCGERGVEEFDPSGARVGRTAIHDSPPRWLFLPGRNERWSVEGIGRIELVGADGEVLEIIERGANGRWFQGFFEAAVAPDGGLAVLDEPNPWISSRDPSTWVHLISPTGEPQRSSRIPDQFTGYPCHIAFDGRRIALLHGRALLLLNEDGSPIGRMTLSAELGEPYYVFFSPSGSELWVFPHCRPEMHRFALPE